MEKIDWSKEKSLTRNFCGYCSPGSVLISCNGGCFTRDDIDPVIKKQNKMTHIIDMLRCITMDRKHLDKREHFLQKELLKIKRSNPIP